MSAPTALVGRFEWHGADELRVCAWRDTYAIAASDLARVVGATVQNVHYHLRSEGMVEGRDYEVLKGEAWRRYRCARDQTSMEITSIPRFVILGTSAQPALEAIALMTGAQPARVAEVRRWLASAVEPRFPKQLSAPKADEGKAAKSSSSERTDYNVDGWTLTLWADCADGEPRILDTDAAVRLGFGRPRDIRQLIERIWPGNTRPHVRGTVTRTSMPRGGVREVEVNEYWLTEAELLKVCARATTKPAEAILDDMIRVYRIARRLAAGAPVEAAPTPSVPTLPPPKKTAEGPSYADLSTVELRIYRPTLESARRAASSADLSLDDLVERLLMAHLNTRYALGML